MADDDHVELDVVSEEVGAETKADPGDDIEAGKPVSNERKRPTEVKEPATAPSAPAEPPFRFFQLLRSIHAMVVRLPGFNLFIFKYIVLQLVRLTTAVSILFIPLFISDSFDVANITPAQYTVFMCLGVLQVVGRLTPFATKLIIDRFKENLQAAQATAIVAKLFDLQHDAMLSTPTGEFAQLIGKVFRNLDTLLPALYGAIIPLTFECSFAVCFIGVRYGPISLILLGLFVGYTVIAFKAAKQKAQRNGDLMKALLSEWGKILATAGSYERAHFFGNVDHEVGIARKAFEHIGSKMGDVTSGEHKESIFLTAITLTFTAGFMVITPVVVPNLSGIQFAALAFYVVTFIGGLDQYATAISNLRTAVFEYQGFDDFLGRRSDVRDVDDAIELESRKSHTIEFKNVSFSYGGKTILDDVSFKVEGGQTLGLVGSSGCGKSTVMRLLLRFYRPSHGTIYIDGHDISKATGTSLRRLFSVVTQGAQLFNGTVRENIDYGKMGSGDPEILEAASLAELTIGPDLPLDHECGEKGAKLSGGQQQRVALARAMLKNGSIYLLDEPTTGLDGVVAQNLQKTMDNLTRDATTICITHHLGDLKHADHILYLDEGKILEEGRFDTLMQAKGEFYKQVEARDL